MATLDTLAAGLITAKELPIAPDTRKDLIRYAPGFGPSPLAANVNSRPYTVEGLAKFLGEVKDGTGSATESFKATFGALELIALFLQLADSGCLEVDPAGDALLLLWCEHMHLTRLRK